MKSKKEDKVAFNKLVNFKATQLILKHEAEKKEHNKKTFTKVFEIIIILLMLIGNMAIAWMFASVLFLKGVTSAYWLMIVAIINVVLFSYSYVKKMEDSEK